MGKITREKFKIYGNVFDDFTIRNLFKLASQGHYEELISPLKIGKEANIFTAKKRDGTPVIVKIYRLENADFKGMYDYIKLDQRFLSVKRSRRQIVFAWTQREFRNILKAREAGVRVPLPFTFKDNIIVMEQIGKTIPAPQLKDCIPENPHDFYEKVIKYVDVLWKNELVHGDLSQFNILNDNEDPVFIDFSQCTTTESTAAKDYLERDLRNVCKFFSKHGVKSDENKLYEKIISVRRKN